MSRALLGLIAVALPIGAACLHVHDPPSAPSRFGSAGLRRGAPPRARM
jgi:hypothetical protein